MNNKYLYKIDSKNKIRQWRAYTDYNLDINGYMTINIEHGQQDGKLQTKQRIIKSGKNLDKSNKTTLKEQTDLEISYLYQKQLDDGYVESIENFIEPFRPMLAQRYQDKIKKVLWSSDEYPDRYYRCSRKYDGIRCFIIIDENHNIKFESRTGKPFKYFDHIAKEINHLSNVVLDGELYSETIEFEKISSLVNSDEYDKETDKDIQFFIYDFIDLNNKNKKFEERLNDLNEHFLQYTSNNDFPIQPVWQVKIKTEQDMKHYHDKFVEEGYEGLMLKDPNGLYEFGKRSNNLLKYKEMRTDEYKIKDIFLADNDNGRVQIELYKDLTESDETFKIGTLKGNKEDNYNNYYLNKDKLIGKWLTIQYQTLTSYGIPLFPVGLTIREGKEVNGQFIPSI